jgi:5-methylcytosine-specific restriction endonuclease McrA
MKTCPICNKEIEIKKKYCSRECYLVELTKRLTTMNISNTGKKWADFTDGEKLIERKRKAQERMLLNNPSKKEEVKNKISESMKEYRKNNPLDGDKNPFFGKRHTDEFKEKMSEEKKGKRSYNENQFKRQQEKTPKGHKHPNWNGGSSKFPYPFEFNKHLKEEIKKRDNHSCKICGKETQKLAIHHIDYDKNNIKMENLTALCYSCHSKTNYNRQNWISFFSNMTFCQVS